MRRVVLFKFTNASEEVPVAGLSATTGDTATAGAEVGAGLAVVAKSSGALPSATIDAGEGAGACTASALGDAAATPAACDVESAVTTVLSESDTDACSASGS